jgi:hypothetical protein
VTEQGGFLSDCLLLDEFLERVNAKLHSAASTVLPIDADVSRFGLAEKVMSVSAALRTSPILPREVS